LAYSVKADVRLEAGRIDSITDLTNDDIDRKIAAVDKLIDDKTGTSWSGLEIDYPRVREISTILAAAMCRLRFEPDKAQAQWDAGIALLIDLAGEEGDTGIGATDMIVDKGEFGTFPKNPNAPWSRGRMSTTGIGEVTVDPDSIYEQD
jgi:hypothetical protein